MVAVRLKGRPFTDVTADMVDGVIAVNRLDEAAVARLRPPLAESVAPEVDQPEAA